MTIRTYLIRLTHWRAWDAMMMKHEPFTMKEFEEFALAKDALATITVKAFTADDAIAQVRCSHGNGGRKDSERPFIFSIEPIEEPEEQKTGRWPV